MVRTSFLYLCTMFFMARSEPICTDHNEILDDCPIAVCRPQRCSNKRDHQPAICPTVPDCEKGCVCKEGYLRDENDVCIPADKCKSSPCPVNEVWSYCTQRICRPQECSKKDEEQPCPKVADDDCIPGCVCDKGFFRVKGGWCAPKVQCEYHERLEEVAAAISKQTQSY